VIPSKITSLFVQLVLDTNGRITTILSGEFCKEAFSVHSSVYTSAPFLEGTLDALLVNEPFLLEGMLIVLGDKEFNVDVELLKEDGKITVLFHDRTSVYKYIDELNQKRNDLFFVKRKIAENNKELEALRLKADKANEEKSRFLAMMSHEIRNPLNGILGNAELLANEELSEKAKIHSKHITHSGKSLKVIVDDILDLSRIEAGQLHLVEEEVVLKNIIDNCISNLEIGNTNKNVVVENDFKVDETKKILGDGVRIGQILSNLLTNALKFTKDGFVRLSTSIVKDSKEKITVKFVVEDSGRGMTEEQTKRIFEEYRQNNLDDNRILKGAGLGLAIVKRLIDAMKGSIDVESKLNIGTKFAIQLRFQNVVEEKHQDILKEKPSTNLDVLSGKRILVADDDAMNQFIVRNFLSKEKVILTVVNDGLEALDKLQQEVYDLVLLDINMPNLKGNEVLSKKAVFYKENKQIPFLALTANTQEKDIKNYIEFGFSNVISKPFSKKSFFEVIILELNKNQNDC
jgi:signal transduction histidine kinase/CheY-like chemotaxis protein